jgi:hypothetical protein
MIDIDYEYICLTLQAWDYLETRDTHTGFPNYFKL